jgi:hypothetical protein
VGFGDFGDPLGRETAEVFQLDDPRAARSPPQSIRSRVTSLAGGGHGLFLARLGVERAGGLYNGTGRELRFSPGECGEKKTQKSFPAMVKTAPVFRTYG